MKLELSIARAGANVMLYDEATQKWIPASYNTNSVCDVNLLHHFQDLTFRVVAVTLATSEVVLNSSLRAGMRYNEATPNFHQWRDGTSKQVFGLHFSNYDEAAVFGSVVSQSLEVLNSSGQLRMPWPQPDQRLQSTSPELYGDYTEDIYEECQPAREEEQLYQDSLRSAARPLMELSQDLQRLAPCRASQRSLVPPPLPGQNYSQDPFSLARPHQVRHDTEGRYFTGEREQPPSLSITPQSTPPAPPAPPPPPPPPPPTSAQSPSPCVKVKSISGDLQSIKLKESLSPGTGRKTGGGMASMMEEMKSKLAKRRQNSDIDICHSPGNIDPPDQSTLTGSRRKNSTEAFSPKVPTSTLSRLDSLTGSEAAKSSVGKNHLEALKIEILEEIRSEIEKSKMEIIEIIREEIKNLKSVE